MKPGQSRKGSRMWAAPSAALAVLLLSGCGGITPGTAAVVNGTRITNDEVNDLAAAQCVAADRAAESGNSAATAISQVKQQSLGLLMDTELSLQYAADQGIDPPKSLAQVFYSQLEPSISPLPSKARTVLTDVFKSWASGRAVLVTVGSEAMNQAPSSENIDQLISAGLDERNSWLQTAEINTDPRYSPTEKGFPGGGDGSVSRAGSDFAKSAGSETADPEFVAGLPPRQKCG